MDHERTKILGMLEDSKITAAEAAKLLDAVAGDTETRGVAANGRSPKYLVVKVEPRPGSRDTSDMERISIRVPLSILRAGVKLGSLIPMSAHERVDEAMTQHGINFDWKNLDDAAIDELIDSLADLEIDTDGRDHQVRIRAE